MKRRVLNLLKPVTLLKIGLSVAIVAYLAISAAVLLISILLPLKIPTPPVPVSSKYSLVIMHIIGAFVVVGFLMALCQPERQSKS